MGENIFACKKTSRVSPLEHIDKEGENSSNCDKQDDQAKGPHRSAVKKYDMIVKM